MHALRSSVSQNDILNWWCWNLIFSCNILGNARTSERDTDGVSIAASTDDLIEYFPCSVPCVDVDGGILDQIRIEHTRHHLSKICNGFLVKFLGISDITEGDFAEGVL
jgi:hypothetical protein